MTKPYALSWCTHLHGLVGVKPLTNIKAILEDFGHSVIEAISGVAALEAVRKTPQVDLVITDAYGAPIPVFQWPTIRG